MLAYPRKRLPYAELSRLLIICLPLGLYHLWNRRYRWRWSIKFGITVVATGIAICLYAGIIGLFSGSRPVMAQSPSPALAARDIYPLMMDADRSYYHFQGCVYSGKNAIPITLLEAARQNIPPDERCNPPRYHAR